MGGAARYSVNVESPIAVYVQIENQIVFEVASGRLKAGQRAPSGRDMAELLGVNSNTVMKAYRDLELMGIVEPRRGVGVTVTEKAHKIALEKSTQMVASHLREAVAECVAVGLKESEIQKLVMKELKSTLTPYMKR